MTSSADPASLRVNYERAALDESDAEADPFRQFRRWFDDAVAAQVPEPNAMSLASVDAQGRPAVRIVLLKAVDHRGFTFYTNFRSRKARELELSGRAALLFFWPALERQVRIEGRVEHVDDATADAYWHSRPRLSRIGAWASPQSEPLADRKALEALFAQASVRFPDEEIPRPPHWGGFRLVPEAFEFWQGRASRLHDRLVYERDIQRKDVAWRIGRLAP
jgi:pyridoxamine 5'-phosphate oxidase